jgi:hypothetical protein
VGKLSILANAMPDSVPVIGAQKKAKTVTRDHNLQQIGGLDSPLQAAARAAKRGLAAKRLTGEDFRLNQSRTGQCLLNKGAA